AIDKGLNGRLSARGRKLESGKAVSGGNTSVVKPADDPTGSCVENHFPMLHARSAAQLDGLRESNGGGAISAGAAIDLQRPVADRDGICRIGKAPASGVER